jgi:hypothetical protein
MPAALASFLYAEIAGSYRILRQLHGEARAKERRDLLYLAHIRHLALGRAE